MEVSEARGLPWRLQQLLATLRFPDFSSITVDFANPALRNQPQLSHTALSSLFGRWLTHPTHDMPSFVEATGQWSILEKGLSVAESMQFVASLLRAQHMMGHWIWWVYLRQEIPLRVAACIADRPDTGIWVDHIIAYINKCYLKENNQQAWMVAFTDVFTAPRFQSVSQTFFQANLGQLGFVLDDEREYNLVSHTSQVIAQWVGLSRQRDASRNVSTNAWDTKGWIINAVLSLGHPGVLLLPQIYDVYQMWRHPVLTTNDGVGLPAFPRDLPRFTEVSRVSDTSVYAPRAGIFPRFARFSI